MARGRTDGRKMASDHRLGRHLLLGRVSFVNGVSCKSKHFPFLSVLPKFHVPSRPILAALKTFYNLANANSETYNYEYTVQTFNFAMSTISRKRCNGFGASVDIFGAIYKPVDIWGYSRI